MHVELSESQAALQSAWREAIVAGGAERAWDQMGADTGASMVSQVIVIEELSAVAPQVAVAAGALSDLLLSAAYAVGLGRAALEQSLVQVRAGADTHGKPLSGSQAVMHPLADLATDLDAARLLTYRAATVRDSGASAEKVTLMAVDFALDAARATAVHGAALAATHGGDRQSASQRCTQLLDADAACGPAGERQLAIGDNVLAELAG